MIRVLQILALALAVLGVRVAHAGKPNVVILGLEVVDKGGGIDANTAQLATEAGHTSCRAPRYALAENQRLTVR